MRTRQSPYEIVGDSSDKGGHRYQPLDRFILREVLARRRVMFMLRVMMYIVSYKLILNWIGVVRFVSHEVCSDKWFVNWHFLHCFLQIVSLWSLSIWIRNILNTDKLVNQTGHWNQCPVEYIFFEKKCIAGKILLWKECAAGKTYVRKWKGIFFGLNPDGYSVLLM